MYFASDGGVFLTKTIKANLASGITRLYTEKLNTSTLEGTYTLKAEITSTRSRSCYLEYERPAFRS